MESNNSDGAQPNRTEAQGKSESQLRVETVLDFLNSEIARITDERRQPGWTKWAVSGALAAVFWLLLSAWEVQPWNINNVMLLLVAAAFAYDGLLSLVTLISNTAAQVDNRDRFLSFRRALEGNRLAMLLGLVRCLVEVAMIVVLARIMPSWISVVAGLAAGVSALLFAFGFAVSFLDLVVPRKVTFKTAGVVGLIGISTSYLILAILYLRAFSIASTQGLISDIRLASLMAATWYLLSLLVRPDNSVPILQSLVSTRQKLVLGQIPLDAAIRQIDISLAGLRLSDVMQSHLARVVSAFEKMGVALQGINEKLQAIESTARRWDECEPSESIIVLHSLVKAIEHERTEVRNVLNEDVSRALAAFDMRLRTVRHYALPEAVAEVQAKVISASRELTQQQDANLMRTQTVITLVQEINAKIETPPASP